MFLRNLPKIHIRRRPYRIIRDIPKFFFGKNVIRKPSPAQLLTISKKELNKYYKLFYQHMIHAMSNIKQRNPLYSKLLHQYIKDITKYSKKAPPSRFLLAIPFRCSVEYGFKHSEKSLKKELRYFSVHLIWPRNKTFFHLRDINYKPFTKKYDYDKNYLKRFPSIVRYINSVFYKDASPKNTMSILSLRKRCKQLKLKRRRFRYKLNRKHNLIYRATINK